MHVVGVHLFGTGVLIRQGVVMCQGIYLPGYLFGRGVIGGVVIRQVCSRLAGV